MCTAPASLLARIVVLEGARARLARDLGLQLVTVVATAVGAAAHVAVVTPPPPPRPRPRKRRFEPVPTAWTRIPIEPRFKWKDL